MTAPLTLDVLPKLLQKHADAAAPLPLRMMGAKALVPSAAPGDLVTLLFLLSRDPDEAVRATATKSAETLPDRIFTVALRDEGAHGEVLDWLADRFGGDESALELVLLNRATSDATVARIAARVPQRLGEIIRQNELRLLRNDDIIRALCRNPNLLASTVDAACELCVRNGLTLLDVPQLVDAHRRVHGVDPSATPPGDTAEQLLEEYPAYLATDPEQSTAPQRAAQDDRTLTIGQRIIRMSVCEKVRLATKGNKEARAVLLRDPNKLVSLAAVTSPRITDEEVLTIAASRTISSELLRHIYTARDYLKTYSIKLALVKNPKVPLPTALKLLITLQEKDIRDLSRDRNVPQTVQAQAKALVMKKEAAAQGRFRGGH